MTTFADLRLDPVILEAIHDVGYEAPSPIQEEAIPPLLEGRDVIGQAQTGSGKTAAFGLPMLQYVDPSDQEVQALVLTPTRELCIQVTQALRAYGRRKGVDVVAVFGGAPIRSQTAQLRAGGHVVVGTVGRVKDLISRHSLMLHSCRFVVLDEADEMLDLGFLEDVERILSLTPSSRQTALFSATMPPAIRRLAERYLFDPVTVKVATKTLTVDTVEQFALEVKPREKTDQLVEVIEAERPEQALVFCRTKIRCEQLYRTLRDRGMNVKALHGDMTQGARDGVMISFKDGRLPLLVATDVASRGLDITGISHVINFDVPTSPDVYVHRIGRTGRVGPQRPRDHVLRAQAAARDRGDREARGRQARAVGQGRARGADAGRPQAAAAFEAACLARRRRPCDQADPRGRPSGRARAVGHHPRDHRRHGPRRRVGQKRPDARALLVRRGSREPGSAHRRQRRRHRGQRPAAAARGRAKLSPLGVGAHRKPRQKHGFLQFISSASGN